MKNTAIKILTVVLLLLGLLTCRKDPEPTMDQFELTRENLTVGATMVSFNATYDYSGKIEGIKVCVSEDGVHPEEYEAEINGKNFTVEITGLHPATAYQYYYAVDYGFSKPFTTDSKSFITSADSPTVRTLEVMSLDSTTVRVKCEVVSGGGQEVTERGICWNTYGDPTMDDETMKHTNVGTGQYTLRLEDLSYSTKYYVRAYAKNDSGVGFGEVLEFKISTEAMLPEVFTVEVNDITSTTALCVGNVASNGGGELVECGVCWSLSANPSLSDSHIAASNATLGVFQVTMTGLAPSNTYHVRAYATNSAGTAYGTEVSFCTLSSGGNAPIGAINGLFSVSATQQVWFSQGNLQYKASTNTWRFATNQYDCVGEDNTNISSTYSGWIDLFGWGASGYNHGAVCYQPWSTSANAGYYYAYGNWQYDLYVETGQADWGFNSISNGGNQTNQWRTLTKSEWVYALNTRTTTSGVRYAKAIVNNVSGVILLPDDWDISYYSLSSTNNSGASFNSNIITASQWSILEQHGAVFLPAAGHRYGATVSRVGDYGYYWSASCYNSSDVYGVFFNGNSFNPKNYNDRCYGRSVRLVASF